MSIPVHLAHCLSYEPPALKAALAQVLSPIVQDIKPGDRILVKPNLVSGQNAELSCTDSRFIVAACQILLDFGAKVVVGDSPAFGSAGQVGAKSGLTMAIKPLGLPLVDLSRPVKRRLSCGVTLGISQEALDCHRIMSLPKVKAHGQMRLSLSVKNLFGCVVGARKAMAHMCHGDQGTLFASIFVDLLPILPPVTALADGITAMHVTGPIRGRPFPLGLVGASSSPVALDTALGRLLGASPEIVPIWKECLHRGLPGSSLEELSFPLKPLSAFPTQGFVLPTHLDPERFRLTRILKSMTKRLIKCLPGAS